MGEMMERIARSATRTGPLGGGSYRLIEPILMSVMASSLE